MGAPEGVAVLAHPVHDGFPVVIDLVKQGRLIGQLLSDVFSDEDILRDTAVG